MTDENVAKNFPHKTLVVLNCSSAVVCRFIVCSCELYSDRLSSCTKLLGFSLLTVENGEHCDFTILRNMLIR